MRVPPGIRAEGDRLRAAEGLEGMLAELDTQTLARIDRANPMRVQRAWEVWRATGRPLSAWQDDTPPPLLAVEDAACYVLDAPKDWLTPRIERRFDSMLASGALEEARATSDAFRRLLRGEEVEESELDALGDIEALQGVRKFPIRIKCALLPWTTMEEAIEQGQQG